VLHCNYTQIFRGVHNDAGGAAQLRSFHLLLEVQPRQPILAGLPKTGSVRMRDACGGEGRPLPDLVLPSPLLFPHELGQVSGLPTHRLEAYHLGKRAQGGSDFDLDRLVALCPPCHAQSDAPYARGRLVITARGQGRFTCEVIQGADKWAIRSERACLTAGPTASRTPAG